MKTKNFIAYIKKAVRVFLPLFFGVLFYFLISDALTPQGYQLDADSILSREMYDQLSNYLAQEIKEGAGIKKIREHILQRYPFLCAVHLHLMPNQVVWAHVEADAPLFLINDNYVLTRRKKIVDKNVYKDEALAEVPKIRAGSFDSQQTSAWLHEYAEFFLGIPSDVYEQFDITTHDVTNIELRDKKDTGWRLIISNDHLITDQFLKRYEQIKNENKSNRKSGTVDARFDGMFVLGG